MMKGVSIESIGRVYARLSAAMPELMSGEQPNDVVAAMLLVAVLVERQRPWNNHHVGRRDAFMELVGKMYDLASVNPISKIVLDDVKAQGDDNAAV